MIDELEKLAREAHDPDFPWIDRDAMIGGLFAKGEIDYIAAAKPAAILELIERYRELVAALELARDMFCIPRPYTHEVIYNALARVNGEKID